MKGTGRFWSGWHAIAFLLIRKIPPVECVFNNYVKSHLTAHPTPCCCHFKYFSAPPIHMYILQSKMLDVSFSFAKVLSHQMIHLGCTEYVCMCHWLQNKWRTMERKRQSEVQHEPMSKLMSTIRWGTAWYWMNGWTHQQKLLHSAQLK